VNKKVNVFKLRTQAYIELFDVTKRLDVGIGVGAGELPHDLAGLGMNSLVSILQTFQCLLLGLENDFPTVRFHRISDQNGCNGDNDLNSPESKWTWLCNSGIPEWEWICTRDKKTDFDASDVGMYMYVITGEANLNKDNDVGGPYTGSPRYGYCASPQDCQDIFQMDRPARGKFDSLYRTPAEFTVPDFDGYGHCCL